MITHIIEEAVFLADRIVVMGTRPGHIRQIIPVGIKHPRNYQSPEFQRLVQQIHDVIVSEHLPEEPAVASETPAGPPIPEPLPTVSISEMFGLISIVADRGGRMDVFALDQLTEYDFGYTLAVVKAAEMFDFLDTPKNLVVLTEEGRTLIAADMNGRKEIFRKKIHGQPTFRFVQQILEEAKNHRLPAEVVQEELVIRLPTEDVERLFKTVVAWGRFAELFGYSAETEELYLDAPDAAPQPAAQ